MRIQSVLWMMLALALPATGTAASRKTDGGLLRPTVKEKKLRAQRTTRADDSRQGVKATLKYEQIADMTTARMAHQAFPSGDGLVVVGGRTTGFQLTKTAELWQNGTWTKLTLSNAHDGAFSVRLSDGRYMVGGGFSSGKGVGQSTAVEIYDPQTRTFSAGPQLTVARAQCKAISVGSKVYVSGNWYADDATMDMYNGSTFASIGETDGRSNPYMMADREGNVIVLSAYDPKGKEFGFYTDDDGDQLLLADRYFPSTGRTLYLGLPFTPQLVPMALPDDTRSDDYHLLYNGNNCYLLLMRQGTGCRLLMFDVDDTQLYGFSSFNIPTADDAGNAITWRGGVIVNESKQEVYLIGASGTVSNQTLHVISLNYVSDEWTIATGTGFSHNMLSATWTLMGDGRLACTGGGIKDNTDAQRKAYIFTPPMAGRGDETPDEPVVMGNTLVVTTKNGVQTTYLLSEKPQIKFVGENLRVVSTKADVTYKLTDILRFTYLKKSATGIDELADDSPADVDYQDGELVISGIKAGAAVGVYALDGKLVRQLTAQHAGTYRLSLSALPQGVYVVKADNVTYKIMKR